MGIAFSPGCPCCGCSFCKNGNVPPNMQLKYTGIQPGLRNCGCDLLNNTFLLPFTGVTTAPNTGIDACVYQLQIPGLLCPGSFSGFDVRLKVLLQHTAENLFQAFISATLAPDFSGLGIGTFVATFEQQQDCMNFDLTMTSAVPNSVFVDGQALSLTGCSLATVSPVPVTMNLKAA